MGALEQAYVDHQAEGYSLDEVEPELREDLETMSDDEIRADLDLDETKFEQYTTPGGKNYREILLKLPFFISLFALK